MAKLLLLNGPNLNLLGTREPEVYGYQTLEDIVTSTSIYASQMGHDIAHLQSNAEHELINRIHAAKQENVLFIVFNPGAFTHTSIALRDALLGVNIPFIEVHLSNVFARESFRQNSYLSDIAVGIISGLGSQGYLLAIQAADHHLTKQNA